MSKLQKKEKKSVGNGLNNAALKYKYSIKRKNNKAFITQKSTSSEYF